MENPTHMHSVPYISMEGGGGGEEEGGGEVMAIVDRCISVLLA